MPGITISIMFCTCPEGKTSVWMPWVKLSKGGSLVTPIHHTRLLPRLGLVLLHERFNTGSTWEPYLQNLPNAFRGVPLSSFNAVEMRALQDTHLEAKIDER